MLPRGESTMSLILPRLVRAVFYHLVYVNVFYFLVYNSTKKLQSSDLNPFFFIEKIKFKCWNINTYFKLRECLPFRRFTNLSTIFFQKCYVFKWAWPPSYLRYRSEKSKKKICHYQIISCNLGLYEMPLQIEQL